MIRGFLYRPEVLLAATFAGLILLGALLLRLPFAQRAQSVGFVDALFTSTSAVCVTGLTTVDTATAYSRAGQTTILLLIQLGGLGVMTFGAIAAEFLRLRVSLGSQAALQDSFFHEEARGNVASAVRRILLMTLLIESVGAGLVYAGLRGLEPARGGAFDAVFHSVSAFCNAGFSSFPENLVALRHSPLIVWTLMVLITLGGLGYMVLFEAVGRGWTALRRRPPVSVLWTLHSRVVLRASAVLTFGGGAVLALIGLGDPALSLGGRVLHGLFQSVSARTAGFNTVDIGALPLPGLLILILLMFIGGSPGSCAGGIKTTSATVWLARLWARLSGRDTVTILKRRIPVDLVRRATLLIAVATLWNAAGVMLLSATEGSRAGVRLEQLIFEQISAFGTVGLSTGITPTLTTLGKLWITVTMFVGRVGPLTVALVVMAHPHKLYEYPTERVMIG